VEWSPGRDFEGNVEGGGGMMAGWLDGWQEMGLWRDDVEMLWL
jgi:hypothetical protein